MATRNDFVSASDGDQLNVGYFNGAYTGVAPQQNYVGSDFDTSRSDGVEGAGTTTASHTLEIAGGLINTGVMITVTARFYSSAVNGTTDPSGARTTLTIETAEHSGSFTSRFSQTMSNANTDPNGEPTEDTDTIVGTTMFYYEPTADEKTNGLDIKFTTTSVIDSTYGTSSCSATNIQTLLRYW